jgi:hypothetical protein
MSENKVRVSIDQLVKTIALVPVFSLVLALSFEASFSLGLGFNALQFYVPTDFMSMAIRFVLPSTIPPILGSILFIVGASFIDLQIANRGDSKVEKYSPIRPLIVTSIAIILISLLFGIFSLLSVLLIFILLTIPFTRAVRTLDVGVGVKWLVLLSFLCLGFVILRGYQSGKSIWKGKIDNLPIVELVSAPSSSARLVRLLSNGALLVEPNSNFLFVQLGRISAIKTEPYPDEWPGLLCPFLDDCSFLGGYRDWDGTVTIDLR